MSRRLNSMRSAAASVLSWKTRCRPHSLPRESKEARCNDGDRESNRAWHWALSRRVLVVCDQQGATLGLLPLRVFHAEREPPDVCCTIYASISLQGAGGLGG